MFAQNYLSFSRHRTVTFFAIFFQNCEKLVGLKQKAVYLFEIRLNEVAKLNVSKCEMKLLQKCVTGFIY